MRVALTVVLAVSAVMDLALGVWASAFWESFRRTWFLAPAGADGHEPQLLGLVLGLILIFFAAMQIDAIVGIRREREGTYRFPVLFGAYLIVSSVVTFLVIQAWSPEVMSMGGLEFLLTDGLRGGCLVVLGVLAMRAPATVTELRLPKQATKGNHSSGSSRDREPWRRGREGRGRNRSDRSGSQRGQGRRPAESANRSQQSRSQQPSRQSRPSAEPARSGAAGEKGRSLSVVVRGDFPGPNRGQSSPGNGGNETGRDGRRRRRRRSSAAQRSERGNDSVESTHGAGMEGENARALKAGG